MIGRLIYKLAVLAGRIHYRLNLCPVCNQYKCNSEECAEEWISRTAW